MRIAVVGAGPAGMMCAAVASRRGAEVALYDKNEKIGKKLYLTGKGRCNLTNMSDASTHVSNILTNPKFMHSALAAFDAHACRAFFAELGLKTKVERGNRVFPESDKSSDVIRALERCLRANDVEIRLNDEVAEIAKPTDSFTVASARGVRSFDRAVIATGGITYPSTGCSGSGYAFAASFGHAVTDPRPALCPIPIRSAISASGRDISFSSLGRLRGVALKNVEARIERNGVAAFAEFGELIFTDSGVSGPIILTLSSRIAHLSRSDLILALNLKPALAFSALSARIQRDFDKFKPKLLKNSLGDLLPRALIPVVLALSELDPHKSCSDVSRAERETLARAIGRIAFRILPSTDLSDAVITSGGVSVAEIDPKTMESKLCPGLYFAGETIDVDALTGGFNLQIAFSTGHLAGRSASS